MILFDSCGREDHPLYQGMAAANSVRMMDFLRSATETAISLNQPFISQTLTRALNFHAIACLHPAAGEYRPCPVTVGDYVPPAHWQVPTLMETFINDTNHNIGRSDPVFLAAYVLWRLNAIHPFINGNGRTARAVSYYVLCVSSGGWLPGAPTIPELIEQNRADYYAALKLADASLAAGTLDLTAMHGFLAGLLAQQVESANANQPEA